MPKHNTTISAVQSEILRLAIANVASLHVGSKVDGSYNLPGRRYLLGGGRRYLLGDSPRILNSPQKITQNTHKI